MSAFGERNTQRQRAKCQDNRQKLLRTRSITEQGVVRVGLYLSGKAVALGLQRPEFKSCCGQCVGSAIWVRMQRQTIFFFFFGVRCFDFVPFSGDPQERRGYVAILPRGYPATESGILKKGMVQPGWGATGKVPSNTNITHIG